MRKQALTIDAIPAILWGPVCERLYLFVHGQQSRKEEAEGFARLAVSRGDQVLSFDLPGHGDRQAEDYPCTVQNAVHDLGRIGEYAASRWKDLSLFGSSLGAYFSLVAYRELQFEKCLFQSPILDMVALIQNMMKWSNVTEELLEEKGEIPVPLGEPLSWAYYQYARENRIVRWDSPTYILYGSRDDLTPPATVEAFTAKFHCRLEVLAGGEHYFHTPEQLEVLERWLDINL